MNSHKAGTIDMSSKGIDLRLREVAQLYRLGIALKSAKKKGKVNAIRRKRAENSIKS